MFALVSVLVSFHISGFMLCSLSEEVPQSRLSNAFVCVCVRVCLFVLVEVIEMSCLLGRFEGTYLRVGVVVRFAMFLKDIVACSCYRKLILHVCVCVCVCVCVISTPFVACFSLFVAQGCSLAGDQKANEPTCMGK